MRISFHIDRKNKLLSKSENILIVESSIVQIETQNFSILRQRTDKMTSVKYFFVQLLNNIYFQLADLIRYLKLYI